MADRKNVSRRKLTTRKEQREKALRRQILKKPEVTEEQDMAERERLEETYVQKMKKKGFSSEKWQPEVVSLEEQRARAIKKLILTLLPLVLLYLLLYVVFFFGTVPSKSMEPTLKAGDVIVTNRLAYMRGKPQRGDVVVFSHNRSVTVKRIIGISGDHIEFMDGLVYVNGSVLNEPYLPDGAYTLPLADGNGMYIFDVPQGQVFVLGDNRTDSADSRFWTDQKSGKAAPYVPESSIIGRTMCYFRLNPLSADVVKRFTYAKGSVVYSELETTTKKADTYYDFSTTETAEEVIVETLPVDSYGNTQTTLPLESEKEAQTESEGTDFITESTEEQTLPVEEW